jgi:hypothetical protein
MSDIFSFLRSVSVLKLNSVQKFTSFSILISL